MWTRRDKGRTSDAYDIYSNAPVVPAVMKTSFSRQIWGAIPDGISLDKPDYCAVVPASALSVSMSSASFKYCISTVSKIECTSTVSG